MAQRLTRRPSRSSQVSAKSPAWVRRGLLFEREFWARLEERARVENVATAPLLRTLAAESLDARSVGRGAIAKGNAERLIDLAQQSLKQLRALGVLMGALGRAMVANQQLLVHWATREDVMGINEDDLLAELQVMGAEGWQQVLDELKQIDEDASDASPEEG